MSIAIISDTHIGDRSSFLALEGSFVPNSTAYRNLKKGILEFTGNKPLNFFVLCGDIMDFSINPIDDSIRIARPFFRQISIDRLAERVIYIPGNHDKQVWDGVQWDTSIIGNLSEFRDPKSFARIQPVVIDTGSMIDIDKVKPDRNGQFGDLFLKGLFNDSPGNPEIILAYPNLYIKKKDETIIVTHGHMFETAWVLLSDLLHGVSGVPDNPDLKALEEWNIPLTSMICTGVGSAGEVSDLFYAIECEVYRKKTKKLSDTLDKVLPRIKDEFDLPWYVPGFLIKKIILSSVADIDGPRDNKKYFEDKSKAEHFKIYFNDTKKELSRLGLPDTKSIIFGHTHDPYGADHPLPDKKFPEITFYNTGGWLKPDAAEVFLIDAERFTSFRVKTGD